MDLTFVLYIFFSILLLTGGFYSFYSSGQEILAVILFVGFLAAIIMFGIRWFSPTGTMKREIGSWPPVINYCPDYLTLHTVNGKAVCIDTVGVAKSGGIRKWTGPTQMEEEYLFHLFVDQSANERIKSLCEECAAKKVSWEGVYEAGVCLNRLPPAPSLA